MKFRKMKKIRNISLLASIIFSTSIAFAQLPIRPDYSQWSWKDFNSYSGGSITPSPSSNSNYNSNSNYKKERTCLRCNGSGTVIEYSTGFGNTKWCNQCGKEVRDAHYHATCPSCKGTGKTR